MSYCRFVSFNSYCNIPPLRGLLMLPPVANKVAEKPGLLVEEGKDISNSRIVILKGFCCHLNSPLPLFIHITVCLLLSCSKGVLGGGLL